MNKQNNWAEALGVNEEQINEWKQSAGNSDNFTYWCLKNKKIDTVAYLKWAQEHYQLPALNADYKNLNVDPTFMEQTQQMKHWSEGLIPLCYWDNVMFIACTEPMDLNWSFQTQYVLASPEQLDFFWSNFNNLAHQAPALPDTEPEIQLNAETDNSVSTTTVDEVKADAPPLPEVTNTKLDQPPKQEAIELAAPEPQDEQAQQTEAEELSLPELPVESAEIVDLDLASIEAEAPALPDQDSPVGLQLPTDSKDSKSEEDLFNINIDEVNSKSESLFNQEADTETSDSMFLNLNNSEENSSGSEQMDPETDAPAGFLKLEEDNSEAAQSTSVLQFDSVDDNNTGLGAKTEITTADNIVSTQHTQFNPDEKTLEIDTQHLQAALAESELQTEVTDMPNTPEASEVFVPPQPTSQDLKFDTVITSEPDIEQNSKPPEQTKTLEFNKDDDSLFLGAEEITEPGNSSAGSPPPVTEFQSVFNQLAKVFESSFVVQLQGTQLNVVAADNKLKMNSQDIEFNLDHPSFLKYVFKTHKEYHGSIPQNDMHQKLFENFNLPNMPEHITAIPLGNSVLVCYGDKSCNTDDNLNFALLRAQDVEKNFATDRAA